MPLNLEYKLEVWDSPNSAGIIIDAVRAAKIAKDRGIGGPILPASAYLMKSPPEQLADDVARDPAGSLHPGLILFTHRRCGEIAFRYEMSISPHRRRFWARINV